ncbi:MAG: DUF2490 domain-containing protein [Cyclobacteriaceae bacterium]
MVKFTTQRRFRLLSIVLLFALLIGYTTGKAQGKEIYKHNSFWSKTEVNEVFEESKWGLGFDFVFRTKNELGEGSRFTSMLRQSYRPWVHYQFSQNARLSVSPIGYMQTQDYIGKPSDYLRPSYREFRTTIQFFHHFKQADGRIMHTWRYRYEMRWQEQPLTDEYRYSNRFRLRYRVRVGLNSSDFYANRTLYTSLSNEIGINFGKNVTYMFNQNRLYIGMGYRFLTAARVELRYVNRLRSRGGTGFEYDLDRGIMLGLYIDQLSLLGTKDILKVRYFD